MRFEPHDVWRNLSVDSVGSNRNKMSLDEALRLKLQMISISVNWLKSFRNSKQCL